MTLETDIRQNIDMHYKNPILSMGGEEGDEDGSGELVTVTRTKRPPKYKVLLHNDDYTTMEFVVYILKKVFNKTSDEAHEVMLSVHSHGRGVCGVYTHEVAESKMNRVSLEAKENGHPLLCTIEAE